mgnify:CR=1 FL=1
MAREYLKNQAAEFADVAIVKGKALVDNPIGQLLDTSESGELPGTTVGFASLASLLHIVHLACTRNSLCPFLVWRKASSGTSLASLLVA